jgi:hypothetical protein
VVTGLDGMLFTKDFTTAKVLHRYAWHYGSPAGGNFAGGKVWEMCYSVLFRLKNE